MTLDVGQHGNEGPALPPEYSEFFACFNRGEYFEAHEVLEKLWLQVRGTTIADYYKGLIQLAGAFVHLQKNRLRPAVALFKLADANLARFPAQFQSLDVGATRALLQLWQNAIEEQNYQSNPYLSQPPPELELR